MPLYIAIKNKIQVCVMCCIISDWHSNNFFNKINGQQLSK